MDQKQYSDIQTEKELGDCGLSQDSIDAIRSTSVVTHNGAQHVVPGSQSAQFATGQDDIGSYGQKENSAHSSDADSDGSLKAQLEEQQNMFSRFKAHADKRISQLESAYNEAVKEINDLKQQVETIKSNQKARQQQSARQNFNTGPSAAETEAGKTTSDAGGSENETPDFSSPNQSQQHSGDSDDAKVQHGNDDSIDRNKTSPSDVQVENIFYCGYQ